MAEDLATPWLSWDGTTQKGVEETMPNPKWAFRSVDNEVEAIVAGQLTPKYFKGIKTVAGIGNDYSYGHDCWETYQAVLKRYIPDVKFVLELFPKLGVTDFTSHIAAIQQSKADLLMCSFWSGDATIIMKQAAAVGLFKTMKGVFTTAGGVHDSLKKEFTPEGLLLGYNSMYFDDPKGSALLKQFVREYKAKYNEYPPYECDHALLLRRVLQGGGGEGLRRRRAVAVQGAGGEGARGHRGRVALRQAELARGSHPDVQLLPGRHHPQERLRLRDDQPARGRLHQAGHEAGRRQAHGLDRGLEDLIPGPPPPLLPSPLRGEGRRAFLALLTTGVVTLPRPAGAQPAGRVYRLGILAPTAAPPPSEQNVAVILIPKALREYGLCAGPRSRGRRALRRGATRPAPRRWRATWSGSGWTSSSPSAPPPPRAVKTSTTTIPIVLYGNLDPVAAGLVKSLAKPESNITGVLIAPAGTLAAKKLELLKEAVPGATRIAFLAPSDPGIKLQVQETQQAAATLGIKLAITEVQAGDYERAFAALTAERPEALFVGAHTFFVRDRKRIIALAAKHRLPAMYEWSGARRGRRPDVLRQQPPRNHPPGRRSTWTASSRAPGPATSRSSSPPSSSS